jgi:hypothetical protein
MGKNRFSGSYRYLSSIIPDVITGFKLAVYSRRDINPVMILLEYTSRKYAIAVVRKAPMRMMIATETRNPIIPLIVEAIWAIRCEPKTTIPRHHAVAQAVRAGVASARASMTASSARG